jgi:hypothetical protein
MSEANARKFLEKMEHDRSVVDEVKKAHGDMHAVAKKHHLDCTASELRTAVKGKYGDKKSTHFDDPNLTCFV